MAQHSEEPAEQAKRLGLRARTRRRELSITQQDVADLAGVSVRSVHEFERGKATIRFDVTSAIMTSLGLTLEAVMTRVGASVATGVNGETP